MTPVPAGRQNGHQKEAVITEIWTEDAKDAWFRTQEWTDMSAPEAPISHIVTFRPDIRIRVVVPPWADADAWLEAAHTGWNDWLAAGGEIWTAPAGEALIDVQVLGSIADIDEFRWGQARTNGRTHDPDPDRATAAQLALPLDDELSAALWALEETLLALIDLVADACLAADTAGRLAALVDPDRSDAVRPSIGLTEVIPLAFPLLPRPDVDQLVAVATRVIAPNVPDDVAETVAEMAAAARPRTVRGTCADAEGGFRSEITGVLAVIQVDHSDDLDALARLYQPVSASRRAGDKSGHETVMLTDPEAAAYGRVVDRCLTAWRPGDPLARFLYKGR